MSSRCGFSIPFSSYQSSNSFASFALLLLTICGQMADDLPSEEQLSRYFSQLGKKGMRSRYAKMTAAERKALATKASKAAAKVRSAKAKKKRKKG